MNRILPFCLIFMWLAISRPDPAAQRVFYRFPANGTGRRDAGSPAARAFFIENDGQFDPRVRFAFRSAEYTLWIAPDALWLSLPDRDAGMQANLRIVFAGANKDPVVEGLDRQDLNLSYLAGARPEAWQESVPVWSGVRYRNLYPGVDLVLHVLTGEAGVTSKWQAAEVGWYLESPAVSLQVPVLIQGAEVVSCINGEMRISTPLGSATLTVPDSSPAVMIAREPARGNRNAGPARGLHTSGLGSGLVYGTLLGGSAADRALAVQVDSSGRIYLAGQTESVDFPAAIGLHPVSHDVDGFMTRFDTAGANLEYMVLFNGDQEDSIQDIALDASGNAFGAGSTDSTDFPTTPGAYDSVPNGSMDAVAVKIDADGSLEYATFLGGTDAEQAQAIAVDASGSAYLVGGTWSVEFPTTTDAFDTGHNGSRDAFLAQFSADGSTLAYSTLIGGAGQDQAQAIAYQDGAVYLTGWTTSSNFPTTAGALDILFGGIFDAFVFKLVPGSPEPAYSTFLGDNGEDRGWSVDVDDLGQAHIGGSTTSDSFPTSPGAFDTSYAGGTCDFLPCPDGFLAQLDSSGSALIFGTYLGGESWDVVSDLVVDGTELHAVGDTHSTDFPTSVNAYDDSLDGESDAFVATLAGGGGTLSYGSYLGGMLDEQGSAIWIGGNGLTYLAGAALSADFPVTVGAYDTTPNGDFDAFAVALDSAPAPSPTSSPSPTPTATSTPTPQAGAAFLPVVIKP